MTSNGVSKSEDDGEDDTLGPRSVSLVSAL